MWPQFSLNGLESYSRASRKKTKPADYKSHAGDRGPMTEEITMRKRFLILALVALVLALPTAAFAGNGPPSGTFYANDVTYRTVVTPTSLPDHGQGNFDILYVFPDCPTCAPVSDAAPGDTDYNGGRWALHEAYGITSQLTNADDVETQASNIVDTGVRFVCPLIKAKN